MNSSFDLVDYVADATVRNSLELFANDPEFREIFDDFDTDRVKSILESVAASAKYNARRSTRRSDYARA